MKKKVIVTGVNGFVGPHLVKELRSNNFSVTGIGMDKEPTNILEGKLENYISIDLTKYWPSIKDVDLIIHLAGFSAVGPSFDAPQVYINGNTSMVINMAEYYLKQENSPRIIIISSGAIYDNNQPMPITEEACLGYTSPYAVSKVAVENLSMYYRKRGLDMVIARPFNHIGPGQKQGFLIPDLYKRIESLDENEHEILVGNLNTKRDYTDVRDIVRAYVLLCTTEKLNYSIYNICSGSSIGGIDILNFIKNEMLHKEINAVIDPSLVRPTDILDIRGDNHKIYHDTGWKPTYTIFETIHDFIENEGE